MTKKRPKPVVVPEGMVCAVCGAKLTREYGSLMCSDIGCVAYRGPA